MKQFILMIKEGTLEEAPSQSPEEMQKRYLAWMEMMIEREAYRIGSRLHQSQVNIGLDGNIDSDGPYVEPKELIGGVVIFKAADQKEALQMIRESPFYGYHPLVLREADQVYDV